MKYSKKIRIRKLKGGWRGAEDDEESEYISELTVHFTIVDAGKKQGAFLLVQPEGLFQADSHFDSVDSAVEGAEECWGIKRNDWT